MASLGIEFQLNRSGPAAKLRGCQECPQQMQTLQEIRDILRQVGHQPRKQFGQCFLFDKNLMAKVLEMAELRGDETVLVVQIESQQAFDNLDEFIQVGGIDVLLVGPLDLSASVGRITETGSEEVQKIMQEVPRRLEGTGIADGTTLTDIDDIEQKLDWGYRFMNVGSPLGYGTAVVSGHFKRLRAR